MASRSSSRPWTPSARALPLFLATAFFPLACRTGTAPEPRPAATSPAATTTTSASRPSADPTAAPPHAAAGALRQVLDLRVHSATLWHLQGGAVLLEHAPDLFALLQHDAVQMLPHLARGLSPDDGDDGTEAHGSVQAIQGRWPDALWIVWRDHDTQSAEYNMWYQRLFRHRRDRWEKVHETRHDPSGNTLYRGLWEQPAGCLVGLISDDREIPSAWQAEVNALDCPGQPAPRSSFKPAPQPDVAIAATLGFASGHVLVLEQPTRPKNGASLPPRLAVSRPGPPNRTEIPLPLSGELDLSLQPSRLTSCQMLGPTPDNVFILGNITRGTERLPLLLHFDGASFTSLPTPPTPHIGEADLAEDGTLVLLGSPPASRPEARSIWALPRGGTWTERPMPVHPELGEPYRPWSLAAHSLEDLWVVGYHEKQGGKDRHLALFHSRPLTSAAPGAAAAAP